jgi:hypothetical protein
MSTASELFGTNIRATVTTTAPNVVRGSLILVSALILFFRGFMENIQATIAVGVILFILAFLALWKLEETYHKDLNYVEED